MDAGGAPSSGRRRGEWRGQGSGGDPLGASRRGGSLGTEGSLLRPGSRLERLPSAALQQIPEHAAAAGEGPLGPPRPPGRCVVPP